MSDRLANAIVEKLKQSSLARADKNNILLFSDTDIVPDAPYITVKPEIGTNEGIRNYRIIVHHKEGAFDILEDFVLKELDQLLLGGIDDSDGSRYKLFPSGLTDIMPEGYDNTYFMERIYSVPLTVRF